MVIEIKPKYINPIYEFKFLNYLKERSFGVFIDKTLDNMTTKLSGT